MDTKEPTTCPHCGSAALATELGRGPHYAALVCDDCGAHIKWLPAPMTFERAAAFTLQFGRFKGLTIKDIARTPRGRDYLKWLVEQSTVKGGVRRAIEAYRAGLRERAAARAARGGAQP